MVTTVPAPACCAPSQIHLTNIFGKTGVGRRAELVGVLFHTHFEPRVRDNERRTTGGRASRPGPMPAP